MVFRSKSWPDAVRNPLFLIVITLFAHSAGWLVNLVFDLPDHTIKALFYPMLHLSNFHPGPIWFLVSLAFVQISYRLILSEHILLRALAISAISVLFLLGEIFDKNPFQITSILPGVLFFAIGHAITCRKIPIGAGKSIVFLSLVLFLVTAIAAPYNGGCLLSPALRCNDLPGQFAVLMVTGKIGFIPLFLFTALTGSAATLLLASWLAGNWPKFAREVSRLGTVSLDLLIINAMALEFIEPMLRGHLRDSASSMEVAAIALAFAAAQIASLPILGKGTGLLTSGARRVSASVVSLFGASSIAWARK
jgi:hypothetical protein